VGHRGEPESFTLRQAWDNVQEGKSGGNSSPSDLICSNRARYYSCVMALSPQAINEKRLQEASEERVARVSDI